MVVLDNKLISSDINDEFFLCDLVKCKGACCVEGDLGAPLDDKELAIIEDILPKVKPYLRSEGLLAIAEQGAYVLDFTNEFSTPLVHGRECAYVTFDQKGIAKCGIELAYEAGDIDFKKPVSCHLYPIRVKESLDYEAINYDRWDICAPACKKGMSVGLRVYEFLKEALIRKFGEGFYQELDAVMKARRQAEASED